MCDALHAHSCLPSAARVLHVPGRVKCTGGRGDGCVSTPPRGRESIAAPWRSAAGIPGLAARHHGRVVMQRLGEREREKERDCSSGWLCVCVCVCVCVSGPRRVSVNARLCFLKVPWQHKCVHQYACTDICKYTQPSSCVHAGISVLTFLPKVFLSMYSLYCYHVCPQPPQFRLFSGKLPHKQKCCSSDIWFLFFFCGCPGESSVMLKHLEVLLKVWVTACWVRPAFVQMKCEPIRGSYNTSPTDLVKRVSSSHSRWFTGFIVTDDMEMNHARAPLSDDFLFWLRVPLGSPTRPPSYRSCIYRQWSITAVFFFTWLICCQQLRNNNILRMLAQPNQSSLQGKHVQ